MARSGMIYDVVHEERHAFSQRLHEALAAAGYGDAGPSEIARLYNYHCPDRVSHHAVHKWLKGEAIPVQHRLVCLSDWLQCGTEWLRYGIVEGERVTLTSKSRQDTLMVRDLALLDDDAKQLVRLLVQAMLSQSR